MGFVVVIPTPQISSNANTHTRTQFQPQKYTCTGPLAQAQSAATTYEKIMRLEYGYAVATEVRIIRMCV